MAAVTVEEKVEELALLVMMLAETDEQGVELVLETCRAFESALEKDPSHERLYRATKDLVEKAGSRKGAEFLKLMTEFVETTQRYLARPDEVSFPNETENAPSPRKRRASVDLALLAEFVEAHTLKAEEFEASLLELTDRSKAKSPYAEGGVKAYLHSLKGDAGTIGLFDIERAVHFVEDILTVTSVDEIAPALIIVKEWLGSCLDAYTDGNEPAEECEAFIRRFVRSLHTETAFFGEKRSTSVEPGSSSEDGDGSYLVSGDSAILDEFVLEADDHLQAVEGILLEKDAVLGADAINAIFRAVHSVKGGSAYFNLMETTKVSHTLENVLDRVRKGEIPFGVELKSLVLTYIDLLKTQFPLAQRAMKGDRRMERNPGMELFLSRIEAYLREGSFEPTLPKSAEAPLASPSRVSAEESREASGGGEKLDVKSFIKVDTARLDRLIEYIGEMVISSSILIGNCRGLLSDHAVVMSTSHQLEQLVREIQQIGMAMRLIPIKGLFQKMSRLVWDTGKRLGKDIHCVVEGEETELDRTVIDQLADPLMHMVRNSLDHGIEPPAERRAKGKPAQGTVKIAADHFGGTIHITVTDDGRGLDPEKLVKKAVERGILPEGARPSKQEIFQLIFAPGFSTAEKVTDLSGRGVGMDVVRRNIEAMRGRVIIDSELGKGTVFTIELPLTLAIVDGVVTQVGSERFIIPTHSVVEFVRPTPDMLSTTLNSAETFFFRGRFLPIFRLSELYGITPRFEKPTEAILAVVESNDHYIALMLDEVVGGYSTVIKPLGEMFREVKGLTGCAIMPDGEIGLILDTATLMQLARNSYKLPRRLSSMTASLAASLLQ